MNTLERVTKAIIDTVDTRKDDYECLIELEAQAAIDEHLDCLIERAEKDIKDFDNLAYEVPLWLKAQKNEHTS